MSKLIVIICLGILVSGCATLNTPATTWEQRLQELADREAEENRIRRQEYVNNHPELSPQIKEHILKGVITLGMTKDEVVASWGKTGNINRSVGSWGVHEQWVYAQGLYKSAYLYFENGILTSWQDSGK